MKTRHFAVGAPSEPIAGPAARLTSPKHIAAKVAGFPDKAACKIRLAPPLAQAFEETAGTPLPDIQHRVSQYVSRGRWRSLRRLPHVINRDGQLALEDIPAKLLALPLATV